ncbi:plasmid replication protein, CyRepA1 family [Nitratireductor sp. OM-1]|uniref:plasmid replication protein, CyRepA1 family n=1 Tax=Nitratireductor sp. OM-1 TaxID=1756988 RepID=UPI0013AE8CBD|nr:plasmid replication protein, CyRepA1 family [Nitratireductor sp. OM-1]
MSWLTKKLPVSINQRLINKNDRNDTMAFTEGWTAQEVTIEELAGAILSGYAYSAQFSGNRKTSNFQSGGFVSVDVDAGISLDDAANIHIVEQSATMIYTTASHTEEVHRFRIVFALEEPITDAKAFRALTRSLALRIGGDTAATDPVRIFFGNDKADITVFDGGLCRDQVNELIDQSFNAVTTSHGAETSEKRTQRSLKSVAPDQSVRTADNREARLEELARSTTIYCPFHHDTNPSAFVIVSQRGINGIHCSACEASFWPSNSDRFDFYSFDDAAQNAAEKIAADKSDELDEVFWRPETRPGEIEFLNQQYVSVAPANPGVTFIKSPKGTGKTEFLKEIISKKAKSVLLIGHRRSLIRQMCDRLGLDCYLDEIENPQTRTDGREFYGISLDSIQRVQRLKQYDYVLIDESEQVLAHFLSDTISSKRQRIFVHLRQLIASAKHVIALDADLGWISFNNISLWAREVKKDTPIKLCINQHESAGRKIEMYPSSKAIAGDIESSVNAGYKVFVTSNSKTTVDKIHASITKRFGKKKKSILITSATTNTDKVKDFLGDPAIQSLKYDAVFASPSISSGVDISFPDNEQIFDVVYGLFENGITSHFDCDQQLSRVRHPKAIKVYVSGRRHFYDTCADTVMNDAVQSDLMEHLLTGLDQYGQPVFAKSDPLLQLVTPILTQNRASMNDLRNNFIDYKERQGFTVLQTEPDDHIVIAGAELLKHGASLSAQEYADRLMMADRLDDNEFEDVQARHRAGRQLSETEAAALARTSIERFYKEDLTNELIKLDDKGRFRRIVHGFELISDYEMISILGKMSDAQSGNTLSLDSYNAFHPQIFMIKEVMELVGLYREGEFDTTKELSSSDMEGFVAFLDENKHRYRINFARDLRSDYRSKPFSQLGFFLKEIGLKQRSRKTTADGKTVYVYRIDDGIYEKMKLIAQRRGNPTN